MKMDSTTRSIFARNLLVACAVVAGTMATPAYGTLIFNSSGLSSANVPVSFQAQLTISGDILTLQLTNNSPVDSRNPNDVLGSFYFDIVDGGGNRPALAYTGAFGDVSQGDRNNPDQLQTAGANLRALVAGDNTWQFKAMDASEIPFLGFGIGTVGNSSLDNNFNGNIVGGMDYAIYKGDVTTANLNGRFLVKETATFTFSGASGFTEANIVHAAAFGLGTAPDSFLEAVPLPEPSSLVLLSIGALGAAVIGWRKRWRH